MLCTCSLPRPSISGSKDSSRVVRATRVLTRVRTTSMDVDSAGRIGLSESHRKQANLDREVTVVGNYDHLEVWDRAAADEDDDDEALLDLFFS